MGRLAMHGAFECEVGGVYHVCYFSPQETRDIVDKKGNANVPTNGQIFPYIAHYLTTGDLIYPAHEGEGHISSLLAEMGRLDLVRKLFPNQMSAKGSGTCTDNSEALRSPSKRGSGSDGKQGACSAAPLRIRTKNERWMTKALSRLRRLSKSEDKKRNLHQVYRPPPQQNKGTTLVVVKSSLHGSSHIRVHGPAAALQSLMPNALPITTQPTHHHLDSHFVPSASSAHSVIRDFEEQGFVVTVRSSRVEEGTGALITQWLLYRGSSKKLLFLSGLSSRRTASLGKALGTSKKTMHSLSLSRKKSSKSCSTNVPISKDKSDANIKGTTSTGLLSNSVALREDDRTDLIQREASIKHLDSNTFTSLSSSPTSTSTSRSISSHSKHSYPSSSSSSSFSSSSSSSSFTKGRQRKGSAKQVTEKHVEQRTPFFNNEDFMPIQITCIRNLALTQPTLGHNTKDLESGRLTLGHKSLSSNSISPKPISNLKSSPSLWNLCSKSSVKKVLEIIF